MKRTRTSDKDETKDSGMKKIKISFVKWKKKNIMIGVFGKWR